MKKTFLIFLTLIMQASAVFAYRTPAYSVSVNKNATGVVKIDRDFAILDAKGHALEVFTTSPEKSAIVRTSGPDPFLVNIPSENVFYLSAVGLPENGKIEVIFDNKTGKTGCLLLSETDKYYTWREFFYQLGKKNGLKMMKDFPKTEMKLRSRDSDDADIVDELTGPEEIMCRVIRGNWMLVTVVDAGNEYKTGWLRWRNDEDGRLYLFPRMY
ncbi:MAG: hypothetical protein ACI4CY_01520 [Candidatus Gastranaerophilaceae bacterium]